MKRFDYINKLIKEKGYTDYLEIGIDKGQCYNRVQAKNKTAVDPNKGCCGRIVKTSDDFFTSLGEDVRFDIVFIDGLHTAEQVEKDIVNSMKHLKEGGIILLHDINPPTEESQEVPKVSSPWKGTVWRAMVGFIKKYKDVNAYTLAKTDTGIGVIEYTDVEVETGFSSGIKYSTFDNNREKYLNIVD